MQSPQHPQACRYHFAKESLEKDDDRVVSKAEHESGHVMIGPGRKYHLVLANQHESPVASDEWDRRIVGDYLEAVDLDQQAHDGDGLNHAHDSWSSRLTDVVA
jgi:hypothetical protein